MVVHEWISIYGYPSMDIHSWIYPSMDIHIFPSMDIAGDQIVSENLGYSRIYTDMMLYQFGNFSIFQWKIWDNAPGSFWIFVIFQRKTWDTPPGRFCIFIIFQWKSWDTPPGRFWMFIIFQRKSWDTVPKQILDFHNFPKEILRHFNFFVLNWNCWILLFVLC